MDRFGIILAAGKGSRMKSKRDDISKVSFPILGVPLVRYVLMALKPLGLQKTVSIIGHGGATSEKICAPYSDIVWQREQKGSGHAVMMAAPLLEGKEGQTIVCCGDTPLLKASTLEAMFKEHEESGSDLTVMTMVLENPFGYGRIVKDEKGHVLSICEQRDTDENTAKITEVNAGVYIFNNKALFESLKFLTTDNAAGEYYLTDVIGIFVKDGRKVRSYTVKDTEETLGVNDRAQLAVAGKLLQKRINRDLMLSGVSIDDPDTAYISPLAKIEPDAVIRPGTFILGKSVIHSNAVIGPNAYLEDTTVKEGSIVPCGWYVNQSL